MTTHSNILAWAEESGYSLWGHEESDMTQRLNSNSMVLLVDQYACDSWAIEKVRHQRIYTFELWCWRRRLRVPWTARRSNQSIRKEINPEYSLEGLMLKLQYFGHLLQRVDSLAKTLVLGKIEGKRRRGQQWKRWLASPTQWRTQLLKLESQQMGQTQCRHSCKIKNKRLDLKKVYRMKHRQK